MCLSFQIVKKYASFWNVLISCASFPFFWKNQIMIQLKIELVIMYTRVPIIYFVMWVLLSEEQASTYNLTENNHDYAILAPLKKCHIRIVLSVAWFEDMDPGTYYMMVMDRIRTCLVLGFRFFQPFEVPDLKVGFVHARLSDGSGTPDNNNPNPTKTRRYKPEPDLTWSLRKKGSTKH